MSQLNIAIVVSDFNQVITLKLLEGALLRLSQLGVSDTQVKVLHVPGAIEIPLTAKLLARTQKYAAIICLGAVIRGETSHYDYVCQQVSDGCQKVMLEVEIPVIFGVLTTETEEQALARVGGSEGHKGMDAADVALRMIEITRSVISA